MLVREEAAQPSRCSAVSDLSGEEAIGSPSVDQEPPERVPARDAPLQAFEILRDVDRAHEAPHVDVARFAQHLSDQAIAVVRGGPATIARSSPIDTSSSQKKYGRRSSRPMSVVSARTPRRYPRPASHAPLVEGDGGPC